jgi:hypothetical protein
MTVTEKSESLDVPSNPDLIPAEPVPAGYPRQAYFAHPTDPNISSPEMGSVDYPEEATSSQRCQHPELSPRDSVLEVS